MNGSLPLTAFYTAFENIISEYSKKINVSAKHIELESFIPEHLNELKSNLIPNLSITPIAVQALHEIEMSWQSLYKLEFKEPANMHFRKITECSSILLFLLERPDKWEKYSKKWQLYPQVEMFGRWALSDRSTWHPETEQHFKGVSTLYNQRYKEFEIFFKKAELTGNLETDLKLFKKVDSWISPMKFGNILESHKDKTVVNNFYSWWSHSIHFSPLNIQVTTEHGTSMSIGLLSIILELSGLIKRLAVITTKFEYHHYTSSIITFSAVLQDAKTHPDGFIDKMADPHEYNKALVALAMGHITTDRFISFFHSEFQKEREQNQLFRSK